MIITPIFGGVINESLYEFENAEQAIAFVKGMMYLKTCYDVFDSNKKLKLLKKSIKNAIRTGVPVLRYFPVCLRYYYDEEGIEQIRGDLDDFAQATLSGNSVVNTASYEMGEINRSVGLINAFSSFGIPIFGTFPVMDNELRRIEGLETPENYLRTERYRTEVERKLRERIPTSNFEVVSSLMHFGRPEGQKDYEDGVEIITGSDMYAAFGLTRSIFNGVVEKDVERKMVDPNLHPKYRNVESSRKFYTCSVGDNCYHAFQMQRKADENGFSGCIIEVPAGAEFDTSIFNLPPGMVVLIR